MPLATFERGEDVVPVNALGVCYWNAALVTKALRERKGWIPAPKYTYRNTCTFTNLGQSLASARCSYAPALCVLKSILISSNPSYTVVSKSGIPFGL